MGREIRRVPAGWEHPRNERGHHQPMFDESFTDAAREWLDAAIAWDQGNDEHKTEYPFYWQWNGDPPDAKYYRPSWTEEERTHFQVYETVTEGTPVSPVFATRAEVADWLVSQGHSRGAADSFANSGWAPSMVISGGRLAMGIDAAELLK